MTNKEKALALIGTFATGDTAKAATLLKEDYIQHNLAFGTGKDAFVGAVAGLAQAPVQTTVNNIRAFEDGLIAEHWDNLQNVAAPNPSGHTQIDGTKEVVDIDKTEENKKLVLGFVEDVLMGKNMDALTSYYDGNNYIQHNTGIADGLDGLGAALAAMAEQGIAMVYDETHIAVAEGNFVLVGSQGSFGGADVTFYDLFRVENGKIAEHWDVIENLAEKSTWANENGKFGNEAILVR